jgi:hypothetical protein
MTGNTTQAVLDAVDLLRGTPADQRPVLRARFHRTVRQHRLLRGRLRACRRALSVDRLLESRGSRCPQRHQCDPAGSELNLGGAVTARTDG